MEYRTSRAADNGFETEEEELHAMRAFVQDVVYSDANALMDTLIVCACVCESRALLALNSSVSLSNWYTVTALMLRELLTIQSHGDGAPKPNKKLENEYLYFPDVEHMH